MLRTASLSLISALLVAQTPAPQPAPVPAKPLAAPVEAPKADPKAVLARIGTTVIRQEDFDKFLNATFEPQQLAQMKGRLDQVKSQYLDTLVLAAKARMEGMDLQADFLNRKTVIEQQELAKTYWKTAKADVDKKSEASEEELKAYYEKNQATFKTKGTFACHQILISVQGGATPGGKGLPEEEAKAKILKAKAELAAGKTWEAVAKAYSDDPGSKDKGGVYETRSFGSFVPEFEEAVHKQELGKPGDPVKSKYGFHLIQVDKRTEPEQQTFEQVKTQVKQRLSSQKRDEAVKGFLADTRKAVDFAEGPGAEKSLPVEAPKAPEAVAPKAKTGKATPKVKK